MLGKILNKFRYDIAFMKNPSFRQENEWRLVCFPKNFEALDYRIENVVINSVPQLVVTVPFSTQLKTSFNDILSRIVIGQSRYAELIQRSIVDLLRVGGVDNPNERVILSEIPAVFRS